MDKQMWWAHIDPALLEEGRHEFQEIMDAEPVTIPGWEHLDLCVHRAFALDPLDCYYVVTEGSTGTRLGDGMTRGSAVRATQKALRKYGKAKVEAMIRTAGEQWGYAPRARSQAR